MTDRCNTKFAYRGYSSEAKADIERECVCERIAGHTGSHATASYYAPTDYARMYDEMDTMSRRQEQIQERIATALEEIVKLSRNKRVF